MKNIIQSILHSHLIPSCPHADLCRASGRTWLFHQVLPEDERLAGRTAKDASIPEEPASLGLFSYIRFTCLANLIDLPSVSMPVGLDEAGMPVGLQLIGGRGPNADHHLLDIAVGIEEAISQSEHTRVRTVVD